MLRLTLLLLAGIGVAMLVGGRGLTPEEAVALGKPAVVQRTPAAQVRVPAPPVREAVAAVPAAVAVPVAIVAGSPADESVAVAAVPSEGIADAVRLALAQDLADAPSNAAADAPVDTAEAPAPDAALPPSVAEEIETALSQSQVWYVNGEVVNVREGPGTSFQVVGKVVFGEATEILSDPEDDWVRIRIQGDGIEGYMARRFLQESEPNG